MKKTTGVAALLGALVLAVAASASGDSNPELARYYLLPVKQHPECVTFDPATRTFYASSFLFGGIKKVTADGTVTPFAPPFPYSGNLGVRADHARNTLWGCSSDTVAFLGYFQGGPPPVGSGIVSYDLTTGALKQFIDWATIPGLGAAPKMCNDIAVDPSGNIYATDSIGGNIVAVNADGSNARVLVHDARLASSGAAGTLGANGTAYSAKDGHVYVVNNETGRIFVFETSGANFAEVPLSTPVYGDGFVIDPRNGKGYLSNLGPAPGTTAHGLWQVNLNAASAVKSASLYAPWPASYGTDAFGNPIQILTPTAATYAEGRYYVADMAIPAAFGPDLQPGLFFGVDLNSSD